MLWNVCLLSIKHTRFALAHTNRLKKINPSNSNLVLCILCSVFPCVVAKLSYFPWGWGVGGCSWQEFMQAVTPLPHMTARSITVLMHPRCYRLISYERDGSKTNTRGCTFPDRCDVLCDMVWSMTCWKCSILESAKINTDNIPPEGLCCCGRESISAGLFFFFARPDCVVSPVVSTVMESWWQTPNVAKGWPSSWNLKYRTICPMLIDRSFKTETNTRQNIIWSYHYFLNLWMHQWQRPYFIILSISHTPKFITPLESPMFWAFCCCHLHVR